MSHSTSARLDRLLSFSRDILIKDPYASAIPVLSAVALPWMYRNYSLYVAMGPSGIGYPLGWIFSMIAKPLERETTSTQQYDRSSDKRSWLGESDILERRGERPATGCHCLPHRQMSKHPDEEMKIRLKGVFDDLAQHNSGSVEVEPSRFEGVIPALVLPRTVIKSGTTSAARGEIAHIHREVECSLHVVLSPMDCKLVLDKDWGERHPLSWGLILPAQYVMIYAPRDDEELATVGKIVEAAIEYMTISAK